MDIQRRINIECRRIIKPLKENMSISKVLRNVDPKGRDAMQKILAGGFAAPVVSSFALTALSIRDA